MTYDLVPVEFRLAGALLRHHREAARWTLEEAAAQLGCDRSKISRVETGHRRSVPRQVQELLTAYGVSGRERQAIAALTESARAGWWGEYRGLLPGVMVDHALLEAVADDVMVYEPQELPTFLQTPRYAAAVTKADPALETDEERQLAVRLAAARAAGVRERHDAAFSVVISEAVLRQEVGGEAMLGQLRQLAELADGTEDPVAPVTPVTPAPVTPVTLQVVPFSAGAHPAIGAGPMSIMRFREVAGIGAIYQGWSAAGVSVVRQAGLTAAVRRFETLRDAALSPEQSLRLIDEVIDAWR